MKVERTVAEVATRLTQHLFLQLALPPGQSGKGLVQVLETRTAVMIQSHSTVEETSSVCFAVEWMCQVPDIELEGQNPRV